MASHSRAAAGRQQLSWYSRPMRRWLLPIVATITAGCLTHLPPRASDAHMQIHWAASYETAQAEAAASHRPLLACLVAGELDGLC